jgi:hypothetical protein
MKKLGLRVLNVEKSEYSKWNLEFEKKLGSKGMCGVKVQRVVIEAENVDPIVKSRNKSVWGKVEKVTPFCFVNYGNKGRFLMSLIWISERYQTESIQERLQKILAELVVRTITNQLGEA